MKKSFVSIIIVNWNGMRWLPDCFSSLYAQDYKKFEIVFVDNASKDKSVDWVRTHYPKTKICVNETNLGFADANNVGYKVAQGEYILFLNNDTRVTKTFLKELVGVVERDERIGGAQSKILLMDKPDTYDTVGAFLTPTGFLYHYGFGKKDSSKYDREINLYTAKGACMLFRKSVLDRTALNGNIFDPDYFAYFEETDMCHRVWLAGYRIVYAYKSVIYHKMGATSSSMDNAFVQYHSFKNRLNSYLKNLGPATVVPIVSRHVVLSAGIAWYMLLRGKVGMWGAIHKAFWWNVMRWSKTRKERAYVQSQIRKYSDEELFPILMKHPSSRYYLSLLSGRQDYEE